MSDAVKRLDFKLIALNDGNKVPVEGFGTGTAYYGQDATEGVAMALKNGWWHLDSAEMYRNEDSLARAIKSLNIPRSDLFITTKVGSQNPRESLEKSLKLLEMDYVDLYLIHSPQLADTLGLAGAWKVMEELQKEGKAKSIGVSNYNPQQIEESMKGNSVVPAVNQIENHPYVYPKSKEIIDYCLSKGIMIENYGPLSPLRKAPGGPIDAVVEKIANDIGHGATQGQVLLKWAQQVSKGIIVTTSSKPERLAEQYKAFSGELPELTQAQVEEITEAGKKHGVARYYMAHLFKDE